MTTEEIYDEKLSPLMAQIIATCKEHAIPMLCTFALKGADGERLSCTSAILTDEVDPPSEFIEALKLVKPAWPNPLMMITTRDAAGNVKDMTAVLGGS